MSKKKTIDIALTRSVQVCVLSENIRSVEKLSKQMEWQNQLYWTRYLTFVLLIIRWRMGDKNRPTMLSTKTFFVTNKLFRPQKSFLDFHTLPEPKGLLFVFINRVHFQRERTRASVTFTYPWCNDGKCTLHLSS